MTPSPHATDAPDSPLSAAISDNPVSGTEGAKRIDQLSNTTLTGTQSPAASVASSPRSTSQHSQIDPEHRVISRTRDSSPIPFESQSDIARQTILASFAPRVACFASEDVDDIAKEKGFSGGFYSLLRPFGESVQGKVVIRDSVGASKAWDNFGIRLVQYDAKLPTSTLSVAQLPLDQPDDGEVREEQSPFSHSMSAVDVSRSSLDGILRRKLYLVIDVQHAPVDHDFTNRLKGRDNGPPASDYVYYLRKLLSEAAQVPYESFSHPVACIIAVSSRSSAPLDKIRQLYSASGRGNNAIPPWVGVDYLRYYVLVHDEDHDDIIKSTALFDLMKRHFGLHCFLLRIRGIPCVETNSETIQSPKCQWLTADEELAEVDESDHRSTPNPGITIFDSDAVAIRSFIREIVTQSIVPFMESRVVTWNDQVASKRRGIGGRFMSLSKRWTGFGATRSPNATTGTSPSSSSSNFDSARGYYLPESPEAIMRQLADYTFMLRDFKMAFSTYDSLRADFSNDKAWAYHAAANELASVSYLLIPQTLNNRSRSEMVDLKVDAALYSYLTRCSLPFGAVRCLALTIELLIGRGAGAAEDAARWAIKFLELGVLHSIPQALITERIADIQQSQQGSGLSRLGSRKRQAAFWRTLASSLWIKLGEPALATSRLHQARTIMDSLDYQASDSPFSSMRLLYARLGLKESALEYEDELPTELDPISTNFQAKGSVSDLDERPTYQDRFQSIYSVDAAGFSAVEVSHPDFEPAPSE